MSKKNTTPGLSVCRLWCPLEYLHTPEKKKMIDDVSVFSIDIIIILIFPVPANSSDLPRLDHPSKGLGADFCSLRCHCLGSCSPGPAGPRSTQPGRGGSGKLPSFLSAHHNLTNIPTSENRDQNNFQKPNQNFLFEGFSSNRT